VSTKAEDDFAEVKHAGVSRVLLAYFKQRQEAHIKSLIITKEDSELRILQGRAREISDLIKLLEEKK
jgi:hypothetical protein